MVHISWAKLYTGSNRSDLSWRCYQQTFQKYIVSRRKVWLCDFSQRRILLSYRSFGTTYRFHIQWLSRNVYKKLHTTLRKTPRECRSHLHKNGALKSQVPTNKLSYLKKNLPLELFSNWGLGEPRPLSVLLKIIVRSISTYLIKNAFMNTSDLKNTFSLLFAFHSFSAFLF